MAWGHTHSYGKGESLTSCQAVNLVIGGVRKTAYFTCANAVSDADGVAATAFQLPGYVIDKETITKFTGNPSSPHKLDIGPG